MHHLLEYLYSLERKGVNLGLGPTRQLLEKCKNPHQDLLIVQIAGTNGKGSTAAITARILHDHSQKVGLFTSPHLCRFNERIRIDGRPIDDSYIIQWLKEHKGDLEEVSATFFEVTTVMALSYFKAHRVDVAVLETGLGGRLDATTAVSPTWTALTPIDLDHMDLLGDTVRAIAREKAGILKPGVPCYSVPQTSWVREVIQSEADRVGAPVTFLREEPAVPLPLRLPGSHQHTNAKLAWRLAQAILGSDFINEVAREAVKTTVWPGRYHQLGDHPSVIYDVAHNPSGMTAFLDTLAGESVRGRKWLVLALQKGRKAEQMLDMLLPRFDTVILTQTGIRSFYSANDLAELVGTSHHCIRIECDTVSAIKGAINKAGIEDLVVILGSHYLGPAVARIFKISFDIL
ncbi:MAG: bifunctional folylpolyglutamate synthase/dihydrofolate synthase [Fidelibacterota bacterium]|nr:MAG: bifunctional folylpolyglutamate synthase/dihydrofolate synthase [Candidatus Neomarinimicrobiota bacterium]